jgi:twitching motility protein PilT
MLEVTLMSNDTSSASDFQHKFMQLVGGQQSFSDIHLEQGAPASSSTKGR